MIYLLLSPQDDLINYQVNVIHFSKSMEGNNTSGMNKHGSYCDCDAKWCGMGHHPAYHLVKKAFVLLVIIFVFWLGLRLGELRTLEQSQRAELRMMMMQNGAPQSPFGGAVGQ